MILNQDSLREKARLKWKDRISNSHPMERPRELPRDQGHYSQEIYLEAKSHLLQMHWSGMKAYLVKSTPSKSL